MGGAEGGGRVDLRERVAGAESPVREWLDLGPTKPEQIV